MIGSTTTIGDGTTTTGDGTTTTGGGTTMIGGTTMDGTTTTGGKENTGRCPFTRRVSSSMNFTINLWTGEQRKRLCLTGLAVIIS